MKKTFVAAAVLGALAGSAFAADVTLYGVIDTGLNYQNTKTTSDVDALKADSKNAFTMKSGQSAGNRWGLKGTEDLGNGYKVGFVLENGFDSDTGKLGNSGRMFGREANLYVTSDFGTLSFGRVGALTSGAGSYDLMKYTPFGSGWSASATKANFWLGDRDRMDNTVTYVTPSFAGVKVYAQYSFQRDGAEKAGNERQYDRYVALGAKYDNGPFSTALVVDSVLHNYDSKNDKDSLGVTLGASYDFEVVKLFAMGQYGNHETKMGFSSADVGAAVDTVVKAAVKDALGAEWKNVKNFVSTTSMADQGWKGYTLSLGATAPVLGGTFYAQANYLDSETNAKSTAKTHITGSYVEGSVATDVDYTSPAYTADKFEAKNWGIALGYAYPFSKRTNVYTYASYNQLKLTAKADGESAYVKNKVTEVGFGLKHSF